MEKKTFSAIIGLTLLWIPLKAQETDLIYLADETPVKADILEIKSQKVKYKNLSEQIRMYYGEDVLMMFSESGNYLFPSNFAANSATQFIKNDKKPSTDFLFTLSKKVIPVDLIKEDEEEIHFRDPGKDEEKVLSKDYLAAIIYKDGTHQLFERPSVAAEVLSSVSSSYASIREKVFEKKREEEQKTITEIPVSLSPATETSYLPDSSLITDRLNKTTAANTKEEIAINDSQVVFNSMGEKVKVDLDLYRKEAEVKRQAIARYISIIADSASDWQEANDAIHEACKLFINEESMAEILDSAGQSTKLKIREFLNRVKRHTYDNIQLNWANVSFLSNLKKSENEQVIGKISFEQSLKENNGTVQYGEIIIKNDDLILKGYKKEDKAAEEKWDVLLSGIGITARN